MSLHEKVKIYLESLNVLNDNNKKYKLQINYENNIYELKNVKNGRSEYKPSFITEIKGNKEMIIKCWLNKNMIGISKFNLENYFDSKENRIFIKLKKNGTITAFINLISKIEYNNVPIKILCLDGGGIRGIISLEILIELEKKINLLTRKPKKFIDYFDLICGTSTGGIITFLLVTAQKPLVEIRNLYLEIPKSLFARNKLYRLIKSKLAFICGMNFYRYSSLKWEKYLNKLFKNAQLKDFVDKKPKSFVISSNCDTKCPNIYLFRTYKVNRNKNSDYNINGTYSEEEFRVYVADAIRATTAIPTFFPSVKLRNIGEFVDGGLLANNPTEIGIVEACNLWPHNPLSVVVSIGTGGKSQENTKKSKTHLDWINTLVETTANTENSVKRVCWLRKFASTVKNSKDYEKNSLLKYFRLNSPIHLDLGGYSSDISDTKKLISIQQETLKWIKSDQELQKKLDLLAKSLVEEGDLS